MNCYFDFLRVFWLNFLYELKSEKQKRKVIEKRFRKLLKYAKENSDYYKELYKDIDIEKVSLQELPSVTKVELMKHFDEWVTQNDITKKEVDDFTRDNANLGKKFKNKYAIHQTSGSTGSPITVLEDSFMHSVSIGSGLIRNWVGGQKTLLKFYSSVKFAPKATVILPFNIFSIAPCSAKDIVGFFPKRRQKNTDFIDISTEIEEIIDRLNKHQPDMIATYPTYIKMLCNYQKVGKLNIKPKMITTIGECLTNEIRKDVEECFNGSLLFTVYACTETSSITHECLLNHKQHLNNDWVIIESIDKNGNPVPNGVLSDKCYITNLGNYTQPFIRYELNDRIIIRDGKECGCGDNRPVIEVEGRTPILLEFENDKQEKVYISSISISIEMHKIGDEIELYQFIVHNNNKVEIRLRVLEGYDKETIFKKIKSNIGKYLDTYEINDYDIYLSKDNPQFEKSGKFKEIFQE